MLYEALRPLLFQLDAETSHDLMLGTMAKISGHPALLKRLQRTYGDRVASKPRRVMGIDFPNPVGLAAGLDKAGAAAPAFAALGFGFIELGTVTPKAQPGNEKTRLFRLTGNRAIINRMGFNSDGLKVFVRNLESRKPGCITGINLGKNAVTPIESALDDYQAGLRASWKLADYITINISSPNTKNLRQLQEGDELNTLLAGIDQERLRLQDQYQVNVPIALKVAPDLDSDGIKHIAQLCNQHRMDGLMAANTTLARPENLEPRFRSENGGLSGEPLTAASTAVIASFRQELGEGFPIIGVGGIMNASDARDKLEAGSDLLQVYTGLIYRGPALVREIVDGL